MDSRCCLLLYFGFVESFAELTDHQKRADLIEAYGVRQFEQTQQNCLVRNPLVRVLAICDGVTLNPAAGARSVVITRILVANFGSRTTDGTSEDSAFALAVAA